MTADDRSIIQIGRGARRAEALLIEEVLQRAETLVETASVEQTIQIVVPSHSLREHLLTRLVAVAGRSLLGVRCSTHRGLALQILQNTGNVAPPGPDVFAILARRFARQEPALSEALDQLIDGYSGMLGSVRDLLDAGFEIPHLRGVEEALESDGPAVASAAEIERAQALVRVTARVLAAFDELGVGRSSTLLQHATELVSNAPEAALTTSGVLLHGFADATGVTADFLTALLRAYGGRLVVDRPPDPVDAGREDSSAGFCARLMEHFNGFSEVRAESAGSQPPQLSLFRALGRHAEVREVAQRIRDLQDRGTSPESIGVVLRQPTPYRTVLRHELHRLALPFSGHGVPGPLLPVGRRLRALQEVVSQGARCHVERWLDALAPAVESTPLFDLRVALSALGIARLDQLAALDLAVMPFEAYYSLPVRQGFFDAGGESDGAREVRSRRRRVPREALEQMVAQSARVTRRFTSWRTRRMPLAAHVEELRGLVADLGWNESQPGWSELRDALSTIEAAPPLEVELDELVLALRRQLAEAGQDRFGGAGAGVQVMGVVEARGRTFEHLFLLGLNRGLFPRPVREDPVLSDALRRLLERAGHGVLPDLPIKRRGYEEERYLFAHLLSAAPSVTLSWLEVDDGDRAMPASPLIERLRWTHPDRSEAWRSPPIVGRHPVVDADPESPAGAVRIGRLPMDDQALLAGLHARSTRFRQTLAVALRASRGDASAAEAVDVEATAQARIAVLDELDPQTAEEARSCLSPYLGFVGAISRDDDPRSNRQMWITAVERMAICPWQSFLERLLRIEAVPDPLEALPRINGLLIGGLVHRVLERVVDLGAEAASFDSLRVSPAMSVSWPSSAELDRWLEEESLATVRGAGIALSGFARALAAVVRPYLEIARQLDWPDGRLEGAVAAEVEGGVDLEVEGLRRRRIAFRADRADRRDQQLTLVDYKTGRPLLKQKTAGGRRRAHLREVGRGRGLQAVVYALAAGQTGDEGRFAFLSPKVEASADGRVVTVDPDDESIRRAFLRTVSTVLRAFDYGLFFPRLEVPSRAHDSPAACKWCAVAEACLKQDSAARRRLREGIPGLIVPTRAIDRVTADALLDHWWLTDQASRPKTDEAGGGKEA